MEYRILTEAVDLDVASVLAAINHAGLRRRLDFLPPREAARFRAKIGWMSRKGIVMGAFEEGNLVAFLGGFIIEDFRNAGPGAFCPDWCHGVDDPDRAFRAFRELYREMAPRWIAQGAPIHSLAVYSSEPEAIEAFSLTGFGRIVMDAARTAAELVEELEPGKGSPIAELRFRRASPSDAGELSKLGVGLARHIGSSPILMPRVHGRDRGQWEKWLAEPDTVAWIAETSKESIGFIKAQDPQFDVSDTVHSESTLAINGMYVDPSARGHGIGDALLLHLVRDGMERGKTLVSVDCETTNPEAYAFWTRHFRPVAWGMERRV